MQANSIWSSKTVLLFNKKSVMKNPRDLYFPLLIFGRVFFLCDGIEFVFI